MRLTHERFQQGLSYEAYKAQMTGERGRFEAEERRLALTPADVELFLDLPVTVNVLVLTEDACDVAADSLPLLALLAAEVGNLNVRIFVCSQHPDLTSGYFSSNGRLLLPIIAFFSPAFQALGHWTECPAIAPLTPPPNLPKKFLTAADWRERLWEMESERGEGEGVGEAEGAPPRRAGMLRWFREMRTEQQRAVQQDLLREWRQLLSRGFL